MHQIFDGNTELSQGPSQFGDATRSVADRDRKLDETAVCGETSLQATPQNSRIDIASTQKYDNAKRENSDLSKGYSHNLNIVLVRYSDGKSVSAWGMFGLKMYMKWHLPNHKTLCYETICLVKSYTRCRCNYSVPR